MWGIAEEQITDTLFYQAGRRFGKSVTTAFDAAVGILTMHGNVTQTNMDANQAAMWEKQCFEARLFVYPLMTSPPPLVPDAHGQ